jgi:large subunit ribosomal protein L30
MAKKLKITQTRSIIDQIEPLGLGRPQYAVVKNDTPQLRGMLRKVAHLVRVEEVP